MSLIVRELSVPIKGCHIVKDASFTVTPGKLTGLIGANGSGKSTLLKAIAGLLPDATGDILIDDVPSRDLTPRQRAHRLSYLPQSQDIGWALTVRDIIALGRHPFQGPLGRLSNKDSGIIEETLSRLGLTSLAGRQVTSLSGGEKARVVLGRALAMRAPYLLADEPTAALDPARQLEIMDLLRRESATGKGVLVVLHDLNLAMRFLNEVIVMQAGRILASGPPRDVLNEEILKSAYGITPLRGEEDGEPWLLPWRRAEET